ncbi:MAG: hypothetical protein Q4C29_02850 [bacterium]|nr:hypothetical protein [bacterium]
MKYIAIEKTPKIIRINNEIDINKIKKKPFSDKIINFHDVLSNNFKENDLNNFYNNINNLKIYEKSFKLINFVLGKGREGLYEPVKNKLCISKECKDDTTLYHELFHMSSSFVKDKLICSGFAQMNSKSNNKTIGVGINEGYTELLTSRYFNNEKPNTYLEQTIICDSLEKIIGKDKMKSLYLNADLYGLVMELNKYISKEEIIGFIYYSDFITNHLKSNSINIEALLQCMKYTNIFLINAYHKKLEKIMQEKNIPLKDALEKYILFLKDIRTNIIIRRTNYKVLDIENLESYLNYNYKKIIRK